MTAPKRVLFCRSGGGLPGLQAHAGMWAALEERGIVATHCHGTSAGAIVSALDASGRSAGYGVALMESLTDEDVRKEVFAWKARIPWLDYFLKHEPIRALLQQHLVSGWDRLEKPLTVYATDVASGMGVQLGDALTVTLHEAVLASMSIAGVFPHVVVGGVEYSDGGTFNNCALPEHWRDFDEVWLLIATGRDDAKRDGHGILTRLMRNAYFFGRGQITDALLETGLLGYHARAYPGNRAYMVDQVLRQGWAVASAWSGEPERQRRTVIRLLWPEFADHGALRFVHDLSSHVYAETLQLLDAIARDEQVPF